MSRAKAVDDLEEMMDELINCGVKDCESDVVAMEEQKKRCSQESSSNLERFLKMKYVINEHKTGFKSNNCISSKSSVFSQFPKNDVVNEANRPQTNKISYQNCSNYTQSTVKKDPIHSYKNDSRKVETIRKDMTRLLECRVRVQCFGQEYNDQNDDIEKKISIIAKQLEGLLFQSASSIQRYKDMSTLDMRMRTLYVIQLRRRLYKKSNRRDRPKILQETLGNKRYEAIRNLLEQIKSEKIQFAATFCPKCQLSASGDGISCTKVSLTSRIRQDDKLPPAVRNLFFNDCLQDAFERSPVTTIRNMDWDLLQERGQEDLRIFREWKMETIG